MFSISSCDLLTTREPEKPDGSLGIDLVEASSPSEVISNLRTAFEGKNSVNYLRCFQTKDFESNLEFVPSVDIFSLNPEEFDNWDIASENSYISALFAASSSGMQSSLELSETKMNNRGNDADYNATYKINIQHNRSDVIASTYSGKLFFKIINDGNDHWYINYWQDINDDSSDSLGSWSLLKINFSN